MSISVQNISKSYKELNAVDAVSFEVNSGELFGLIGPDGAGKTTIFNDTDTGRCGGKNLSFRPTYLKATRSQECRREDPV